MNTGIEPPLRMPGVAVIVLAIAFAPAHAEPLANWRFEQVESLDAKLTPAVVGESLTGLGLKAVDPRPYSHDESGKGNLLQVFQPDDGREGQQAPSVFTDSVPGPTVNGKPNKRSLALKNRDYLMLNTRPLASMDLRKSWTVEASVMTNRLEDDQVFVCKERTGGPDTGDLSVGFDPKEKKFYVGVKSGDGQLHRLASDLSPAAGEWYDLSASAVYDQEANQTTMTFAAKPSKQATFGTPGSLTFKGKAMVRGTAIWVVGRGFPIGQFVTDGGIDEVRISGESLAPAPGENPIIRHTFTSDPAPLVVGDTLYLYTGHDETQANEPLVMNEWLCHSTKDMKHWTTHGPVMRVTDFAWAKGDAWAAQVVQNPKDGKFYLFVTATHAPEKGKGGRAIGVAVSDKPTGPFRDAIGHALVTDDMTPDPVPWNDIDPTVLFDNDGTPWLAWGNPLCYLTKLKPSLTELDGEIGKIKVDHYHEGPWLHKRGDLYYLSYATDPKMPGQNAEQLGYATAPSMEGPWTYRGIITGSSPGSYTTHPGIVEFKGQWYLFSHNGTLTVPDGRSGGSDRRSVYVEYLDYNPDGTIKPVTQTEEGISVPNPSNPGHERMSVPAHGLEPNTRL